MTQAPQREGEAGPPSSNMDMFKNLVAQNRTSMISEFEARRLRQSHLAQRMTEHQVTLQEKQVIETALQQEESNYLREKLKKATMDDFDKLTIVGHGAFGLVYLVRKRASGEVFALKQLKKSELMYKNQVEHVRNEKEALAVGFSSQWVAALHHAFCDELFLYLVMEYLPGGDLMTHLIRQDRFSEDATKFYIAELVCAVGYVHDELHYIHRDIKPDNILFDRQGHIKLLDFGLAKFDPPEIAEEHDTAESALGSSVMGGGHGGVGHKGGHVPRAKMLSVVGTPDYMAPEVYRHASYGREVDWWSVGIIMYEMLFGGPPFSDYKHRADVTSYRVTRWQQYFYFPDDIPVTEECKDLLKRLICDPQDRYKTADEIKAHPFFRGVDFESIRQLPAPIVPPVTSDFDTQNFDDFTGAEEEFLRRKGWGAGNVRAERMAFHDFEFSKDLASKTPSQHTDEQQLARALVSTRVGGGGGGGPEGTPQTAAPSDVSFGGSPDRGHAAFPMPHGAHPSMAAAPGYHPVQALPPSAAASDRSSFLQPGDPSPFGASGSANSPTESASARGWGGPGMPSQAPTGPGMVPSYPQQGPPSPSPGVVAGGQVPAHSVSAKVGGGGFLKNLKPGNLFSRK
uniref:non-specific serine/threonine protein kinase n=1 Tax=Chromera velia CCMP2878 TaxID=1169474 RepID=A0A0G4HBB1_9ALVE|eukprot:Cvel_25777.t1-p1 / transcript=Cvel_25777.t1 / gene=Cvel_25777 / organism=Chromera_velia_CCMP2878 / gene_product=Probable serine/threonine-protein kinase ndrA, putative / transcript_product=Probable serine/threonine-protein kinase ndrA, putative / location=Cvel_scaffold2970:2090-10495(+) / protein_length=625 / sequence_SO=supercontig / SO=protein_coding / is_pseudo=false